MRREIAYLDASAVVKLVLIEQHALALRHWLADRPDRATSALARTEVVRAVRALGPEVLTTARIVLLDLDLVAIDDRVLDAAAMLPPAVLRSLDAIHLATAQALGADLDVLVSYDDRMLDGARLLGLPTARPT